MYRESRDIYHGSMSIKGTSSKKCAEWYLKTPMKGTLPYDTVASEFLLQYLLEPTTLPFILLYLLLSSPICALVKILSQQIYKRSN